MLTGRSRPFASFDALLSMYNSLIRPHFDYRSVVWAGEIVTNQAAFTSKLLKPQNRAARILTNSPYDASSDYLGFLGWMKT